MALKIFHSWSFQKKLIAGLLLVSVVPMLIMLVAYSSFLARNFQQEVSNRLLSNRTGVEIELREKKNSLLAEVRRHASQPILVRTVALKDQDTLERLLTHFLGLSQLDHLGLYDEEGRPILTLQKMKSKQTASAKPLESDREEAVSSKVPLNQDDGVLAQDEFIFDLPPTQIRPEPSQALDKIITVEENPIPPDVMSQLSTQGETMIYTPSTKRIEISVYRVLKFSGRIVGVLGEMIHLDQSFVNSLKERIGIEVVLFDSGGERILSSLADPAPFTLGQSSGKVLEAKIGKLHYFYTLVPLTEDEGPEAGGIALLSSQESLKISQRQAIVFFLAIFGVIAGAVILVSHYTAKFFSRPILSMVQASREIGQGKFETRLQIQRNDELGILAESINQLALNLSMITISKDYFDKIITSMTDTLIVMNPDTTIRTVNKTTLNRLGYEQEELTGKFIEVVCPEKKSIEGVISNLNQRGFINNVEIPYLTKDGKSIPMLLSASAMFGDQSEIQGIVCVARDIAELKEAERAIKELNEQLEQRVSDRTMELHKSQARLAGILDIASEAIISIDKTQRIIIFNKGAEQIFGYRQEEVMGQSLDILLPEKVHNLHRNHVTAFSASTTPARRMGERGEIFGRRKSGEEFPAEATISKLELGEERIFTVVLRDITERKRADEAIQKLAKFPAENPSPVLRFASDGTILYCNPAGQPVLHEWGCTIGQAIPYDWQQLIDNLHAKRKEFERKVGDRTYAFLLTPVADADYVNLYGRDITERIEAQEALAEQAIRDTLTNLYNRRYFNRRIAEEITRADRSKHSFAILLCDLNHFKAINDTKGHQVGDEVLKAVAQGIREGTRGADLVFRWGGDEFAVILSDTTRDGILIAAERITRGIHKIGERGRFDLDLSIGVALYPEHGRDLDELIRIADRALYIAKKGGDRIHVGEEEYQLDEHTIKVVFQSVVDIRMNQTVGYEALSRDAQGKLSILALFKKYQAIGQLMELKNICFISQLKMAQKVGLEKVFINVDFNLLKQLDSVPKPSDLEVVLEISEAEALYDVDDHLEVAKKWRELGYKFAIDDFGAGFISLPFIARLVPDHIKLDRSTVLQAVATMGFRRILQDLLVGLRNCSTDGIIAEGIESSKELEIVKGLGIYLVQGYLFGKPEELKQAISDNTVSGEE